MRGLLCWRRACAAAGANIMGAQIYTTTDGLALESGAVGQDQDCFTDAHR